VDAAQQLRASIDKAANHMSRATYHDSAVTFIYELIIQSTSGTHILLMQADAGNAWSLPTIVPEEHRVGVIEHINRTVARATGLRVATLRCTDPGTPPAATSDPARRVYLLESLDATWQPMQGMAWVRPDDLDAYDLPATQQQHLQAALIWQQTASDLRVPWMRRGWFTQAALWLVDVADRMDMLPIGQVQQKRVWWRSATLYLPTDQGHLYFKAVPSVFSYEPVITRVLSLRYPGSIPDVRAVHIKNHWLLTRDFGPRTLLDVPDIDLWREALQRYADIQVDLIKMAQTLVSLGLPDRNIDQLATQVERLMLNLPDALSSDEQKQLRYAAPTLRRLFYELVDHQIPLSLAHGDLRPTNIAVTEQGRVVIMDWSDSAITHPFFDTALFLQNIEQDLPQVPDARDQLRDAYLECWTRYEPMASLKRVYELAAVLSPLYQALSYQRAILPAMEPHTRWELADMLTLSLRMLLQQLATTKR